MSNRRLDLGATDPVDELRFEPVSPKYRSVQIISAAIAYSLTAAFALLLLELPTPLWCVAAEAAIVLAFLINLIILRKAYLVKGYALREHDITYRSGVIFPKTTTVPFSRVQQVSISRNPVSKLFNLCALDIVNGAQGLSSLTVKGLTPEKAETIKSIITRRLNNGHD
ncbi:MAG: PH domain-containing protein [Muribaculaceae bacterium]|nr:PH domain-containing protein [Muribaculaceae bacterium]